VPSEKIYRLIPTQSFLKDIKKLSKENQERVRRALDEIKVMPYRGLKLEGVERGQYRWRVGDLRIRYDVRGQEVMILRVLKRDDAYRKF
jgi:mRNA interferase RelE/StbE